MYVSSETSFRDFTFDGYTYCFVASKNSEGIEKPPYSGGIAVTNLERTVVDSIKDMDKISGIEEVVQNAKSKWDYLTHSLKYVRKKLEKASVTLHVIRRAAAMMISGN